MSTGKQGPLVGFYSDHIGVPSTTDEAHGYWVFVIGVIAGFAGIMLVLLSDSQGQPIRGYGIALASVGLIFLLIGPIIRLPLKRAAAVVSYLGAATALIGVVYFLASFLEGNWSASFANNESLIIGIYGAGVFLITLGSVFVPLLTSPREEQLAAEDRAASAEGERDAAIEEAERRGAEAEAERAEKEELAAELQRIEDSQSQFELFTDKGGKHRWRLRHRNRNVIADSAQGYASRQKAQQGLSAVKRDAFGAGVVDLDELEEPVEVDETDDAVEGTDAPEFVADVESAAEFEAYEDNAGEQRWRLRHENGNILADSGEGYSSASGRDNAIESIRGYVQAADYLRIEPSAFELYRDRADEYRWRLLHENGNILADSGQGYASRQKARQGVDSVQSNVGEGGKAEFDVYEDNAGEYRWRLVHENGNIIADSGEGYASESGARDAVERVEGYAPDAHVLDIGSAAFEIYEDRDEKWRWRLRHRNGNILADSGQGYDSRSGAEDGINSVKQNAPNADRVE